MHPIEHPETIMLIHHARIQDELARRNRRERREEAPRPRGGNGRGDRLRATISHGLMAIARRIEPAASPADRGLPAA
jgi:hypothetical protein